MTDFLFYCSYTKRYLKINSLISSSIIGYNTIHKINLLRKEQCV